MVEEDNSDKDTIRNVYDKKPESKRVDQGELRIFDQKTTNLDDQKERSSTSRSQLGESSKIQLSESIGFGGLGQSVMAWEANYFKEEEDEDAKKNG